MIQTTNQSKECQWEICMDTSNGNMNRINIFDMGYRL